MAEMGHGQLSKESIPLPRYKELQGHWPQQHHRFNLQLNRYFPLNLIVVRGGLKNLSLTGFSIQ